MDRALASVVRVKDVQPIENADFIEFATMESKAWQCVVKKGEIKPGDIAVYMEIDSFLPEEERYEFLRKSSYKKMGNDTGFRLKTARFRGQISQGLLLPLSRFPELSDVSVGDDVTKTLGIQLYQKPVSPRLSGLVKGSFPAWLHKSDQERIQNLVHYFEQYKDVKFEVTVKMDGSSCSVYHRDGEFGVCSRNLELKETEKNLFWRIARQLNLQERLSTLGRNIMLQGELCGEGIQKNKDKIKGYKLFIYDIFDIDNYCYLPATERLDIISALGEPQLDHVPIIEHTKVFQKYTTFAELMDYADGPSYLASNNREGIVCKSLEPINGQIISFKVISNSYLLKHNE